MKETLMLIWLIIILTVVAASEKGVVKDVIHAPLDIISLDDITQEERIQIAEFEEKINRNKRSGSGDILGTLKNVIGQSIKKKIGQVAKASAAASGSFSKSSSSGKPEGGYSYHYPPAEYEHHHPEVTEDHESKSVDWWSIKKSILNTLLQAVKAIKGGVIAVKGQLIKGGGKLISAKGKLISSKGEAITNLGKNLATSAMLVPYHPHPTGHSGSSYSSHSGYHYSAPSAPEAIYQSLPSGPGPYPTAGEIYDSNYGGSYGHSPHDGLLILKKIQNGQDHEAEESKIPAFKPLESSAPSIGTIVGKFLSASSSLDPHKPDLFGHTAVGQSHYDFPKSNYNYGGLKDHYVAAAASDVVKSEAIEDSADSGSHSNSPFEETPNYVNHNFDDFDTSDTKNVPQSVEASEKFKSPNNPLRSQLLSEIKNNTQTGVSNLQSSNINYNTQVAGGSLSSSQYNFIQEPESNKLSSSQSSASNLNQISDSNKASLSYVDDYSLLNNQKANLNNFPQSYINAAPIDPINLGDYIQQYGLVPFSNQNLIPNLGVNNYQSQLLNTLSTSNVKGATLDNPTLLGTTGHNQPLVTQTLSEGSTGGLGKVTTKDRYVSNYNSISKKPVQYLQTPKKHYSVAPVYENVGAPSTRYTMMKSIYSDSRKPSVGTRKPTSSRRYPSPPKPKVNNYDFAESISYEIGPNGVKRLM